MYCKKCGTEQREGNKFCPKCGNPFPIESHSNNTEPSSTTNKDGLSKVNKTNSVINESTPKSNIIHQFNLWYENLDIEKRKRLTYLLIGIVSIVILYFKFNNIDFEADYTDDQSYSSYQESRDSDSPSNGLNTYQSITFDTEQQVRSYLSSHKFTSDDGYTISFQNNANELYLNGRCMTSLISIPRYSEQGALLKGSGPYGTSTFMLTVKDGARGLVDMNDETVYREMR